MKLRTRLVIALVVLATVGLVLFGVVTYSLYRASLLDQLDNRLVATSQVQSDRLRRVRGVDSQDATCTAALGDLSGAVPPDGSPQDAPRARGFDSETRLFVGGRQVVCIQSSTDQARPHLDASLTTTAQPLLRTVNGTDGSGTWRVFAAPLPRAPAPRAAGDRVVTVAAPMSALNDSMDRLVRIEFIAGVGLLVILAAGAWLVLRRGLRPLERVAESAASVTAGDLSVRVEPADGRDEVGQVGLAINTMLGGIEDAFSEREATEQRLRQFLADAAHELRTPLTSIQGYAELFRIGDDHHQLDLPVIMGRIESESARMHALVEDLMLLARLDRTRRIESEPVDLSVLAADACSDAVARAPERRITLDAPDPVIVQGDADHLRQAITNLVANAVVHTPAGTPIEVRTRCDQSWATVTVRDHGNGLDEAGLEHAFDRFWQSDDARVGSGVGLGLSIVAGIAAEHQGRVSVENAADGGASFILGLPAMS